ncbi:MAG: sulfatase-like hydrolase/transferase [Thermogutta sp.]
MVFRQVFLACAAVMWTPHLPAIERPNIVFILVDDLGFGDLSCFRDLGAVTRDADPMAHYPDTPNIDRLAAEGVRLTQFYVASPICSPSRVAITTGRYPAKSLINSYLNDRASNRRHGMRDWLDPTGNCIARLFQEAGYTTAHFGKWHQGGGRDVGDAPLPTAYGFDESLVSFEGLGDRILPPGRLSDQSKRLGRGRITRVNKHEQTRIYVDRCIDFIERNRDRNFYVHLWLNDVHDAHEPEPGAAERFEAITENPFERKFFAVLTEMDRQIGRLVDHIDSLGLAPKTLIVLTGDNGPTAWPLYYKAGWNPPGSTAGFRGRKWSLYEGGIRMPLIARQPGTVPQGVVNRESVMSTVDLLPTFAMAAGIELQGRVQELDGENMLPALLGGSMKRSKPLYWEYGRAEFYLKPALDRDVSPNLAVRAGEWKFLINADGSRPELYRIGSLGEIDEYENVASEFPQVAERLKVELLAWRRSLPELVPALAPQGSSETATP